MWRKCFSHNILFPSPDSARPRGWRVVEVKESGGVSLVEFLPQIYLSGNMVRPLPSYSQHNRPHSAHKANWLRFDDPACLVIQSTTTNRLSLTSWRPSLSRLVHFNAFPSPTVPDYPIILVLAQRRSRWTDWLGRVTLRWRTAAAATAGVTRANR